MPWENSPEKRRRDNEVYGSAEYKRNRTAALRRAGGRCELLVDGKRCGSRDRCQVDHIVPVTQHGTHHLDNLRVLCSFHHKVKTAQEGRGYRRGRPPKAQPILQVRTKW